MKHVRMQGQPGRGRPFTRSHDARNETLLGTLRYISISIDVDRTDACMQGAASSLLVLLVRIVLVQQQGHLGMHL